ncbi:MAG: hypothetical protein ACUVUC_16150 [Thermoguttaceae bacterium]
MDDAPDGKAGCGVEPSGPGAEGTRLPEPDGGSSGTTVPGAGRAGCGIGVGEIVVEGPAAVPHVAHPGATAAPETTPGLTVHAGAYTGRVDTSWYVV